MVRVDQPNLEQLRRCVLARYEGDVKAAMKRQGRRWSPSLKEEKAFVSRAFAICTAQLQRYGYLFEGTQIPTAKGIARSKEKLRDPDAAAKHAAYQAMLRRARAREPGVQVELERLQPAAQRARIRTVDLASLIEEERERPRQGRRVPPGARPRQKRAFDLLAEIAVAKKGAANASAPGAFPLATDNAGIVRQLRPLRRAMEEVFSCDTVYGDCTVIPSAGHCILAAMVIQDLFGGELVEGRVGEIPHYWNRIGAREIDLTGDQFGFAEVRVKRGELNGGGRVFSRGPAEPLDQPFNAEVCKTHDRFVAKLGEVLRDRSQRQWAAAISRCPVRAA